MRYSNQEIFTNAREAYKRYLKSRGMKLINQYDTPKFRFPQQEDLRNFSSVKHVWGPGDRYFKLASEYYGDPELWWVIAFYNKKPTEFHIKLGDVVYVPKPLETVLFYIGY
jgi:nucleoid-associated protein YgaU